MKYIDLIEVMHQYRTGNADRDDMIAAIALWQRPLFGFSGSEWDKNAVIGWMIRK